MNRVTAAAFLDELEKLGYYLKGHKELAAETAKTFAPGSEEVGKLITRGSVATDVGIRTPFLLFTHDLHALPGRTKEHIIEKVLTERSRALKDIAKTLSKGGEGTMHDARLVRGLMDLGQTQHTWVDLVAHHEKPATLGVEATKLRNFAQKMPGGGLLGGLAISDFEHLRARGLDTYKPGERAIDRVAQTRAKEWGVGSRNELLNILSKNHGMSTNEAAKAVDGMLAKGMPGKGAQTIGQLSRNVNFLGRSFFGTKSRAAATVGTMLAGVGAAALANKETRKKILGKFKSTAPVMADQSSELILPHNLLQ